MNSILYFDTPNCFVILFLIFISEKYCNDCQVGKNFNSVFLKTQHKFYTLWVLYYLYFIVLLRNILATRFSNHLNQSSFHWTIFSLTCGLVSYFFNEIVLRSYKTSPTEEWLARENFVSRTHWRCKVSYTKVKKIFLPMLHKPDTRSG